MDEFLRTALTFPTLWWSTLFGVCVAYWLLAVTGLVHHDHGPVDLSHGHGFDAHHGHGTDGHHHDAAESTGIFARLGLDGVPLMVVLTALTFSCWLVSYFVQLLFLSHLPATVRTLGAVATLLLALVPGLLLTSLLVRPLRPLFAKLNAEDRRTVVGKIGVVNTPEVNHHSGMVAVEDGGAGLLLQARCEVGQTFRRGQKVVLLSYNPADNSYLIASEDILL